MFFMKCCFYICVYIYVCICVCVYIYMYIYILLALSWAKCTFIEDIILKLLST